MEYFKLEEVATFVNGYAFSSEKYEDKGIPIIRISDIDEEIKLEDCICYPEKSLEKLKEYTVKKGSLLIALSGATTGKMGVFNSDRIAYLNQRICSIFSKDKNLLQEYLIFYLKNLKEIILKNSYGGAQPNISSKWLEKRVIGIPSLTEQKEIVVILDKLVTIINKKKNQINLLEELVKSRFIEMFGDPIKNEKGWEKEKLLENVVEKVENISKNSEIIIISYIDISSINNLKNRIETYKNYYIDEAPSRAKKIINRNDILMSTVRPNLKNIALFDIETENKAIASTGFCILRTKTKLNTLYLFNVLLSNSFTNELSKNEIGANYPAVTENDIKNVKIALPPLTLQNEFASFVTKTNKLKFEAEKSLKEMENLYESLMQKFFKQN